MSARAMRLGVALALVGLLVLSPWIAPQARAQGDAPTSDTFEVDGHILNGTADAAPPGQLDLKVIAFADNEIKGTWDAEVAADSSFRATGIPRMDDDVTYVLGADYQDVPYLAQITAPDDGAVANQDITVYESADTDPGIRFDQSALIITDVDESIRAVTVTELHTIVNPTDRTFAPQMGGPGGPAGLLVFGLPASSFDLTPGRGLDSSQIVQIGLGFASLSPIYPGRREISFSYRFPYTGSETTFSRTMRYPVDTVRVLVRTPGPDVKGDGMAAAEPANIGGQQYHIMNGGPLAPGAALSFTLSNLPVPGGIFATIPPAVPAAAGALVGLVLVVLYWQRVRRRRPEPAISTAAPEAIVDRLVDLDVDRAAGRISDTEYEAARHALLAEHLLASPGTEHVVGETTEARN